MANRWEERLSGLNLQDLIQQAINLAKAEFADGDGGAISIEREHERQRLLKVLNNIRGNLKGLDADLIDEAAYSAVQAAFQGVMPQLQQYGQTGHVSHLTEANNHLESILSSRFVRWEHSAKAGALTAETIREMTEARDSFIGVISDKKAALEKSLSELDEKRANLDSAVARIDQAIKESEKVVQGRLKAWDDAFAGNQRERSDAFAANQQERSDAFAANQQEMSDAFAANQKGMSDAFAANQKERSDAFTGDQEGRGQAFADKQAKRDELFAEKQAKRDEEFAEKQTKRDEEFAEGQETRKGNFSNWFKKFRTANELEWEGFVNYLKESRSEAADKLAEIRELHQLVVGESVGGSYEANADKENVRAFCWSLASVSFIVSVGVWTGYTVLFLGDGGNGDNGSVGIGSLVFQTVKSFAVAGALLYAAIYSGQQASGHRENEKRYRRLALAVKSVDPLLASLKEDKQEEIKFSMAKELFGQKESGEGESGAESGTLIELILRSLTKKGKIKNFVMPVVREGDLHTDQGVSKELSLIHI
ncbi:MAG: hypothetical protein MPK62_08835, partial [Alphaproteobacteria bacterium]|nr:hypothetical protein [Alphaproteobacteria bacterium]